MSAPSRVTRRQGSGGLAALLAAVVVLAAAVALITREDDAPARFASIVFQGGDEDPLGFSAQRGGELEARAARGFSHVVYEKSPGGVVATARRVARYRRQVERAARPSGADPDLLEAIVLLESAGRPQVIAGGDLEGAVGLTQILAETGQSLLGMRVDLDRSRELTNAIARAGRAGDERRVSGLERRRRRVDERFDAQKALAATGRYLATARGRFGSEDLAVVSYHMGIGNLEGALRDYAGADGDDPVRQVVEDEDLSYARLYFDSAPDRHADAYSRLARLGDDSATYYWRVLASREVMRLWRQDRRGLARLAALHTAKASSEEVLHPPARTDSFGDPDELEDAYGAGRIRPFPEEPERFGLRLDPRLGELADRVESDPSLYRGLRPAGLVLATYIGTRIRELEGGEAPLAVTSAVRDGEYQDLLRDRNREATDGYSLHTTGYAFDVSRRYSSRGQARAFQFVLDRLQAYDAIAWVREPAAIHVTVSGDAAGLLLGTGP